LLSGSHGDDLDLDFKVIVGPTADGEWQPEETDDTEEKENSDNEVNALISFHCVCLPLMHCFKYDHQ
jgi:hypothetical protein